MKNSRIKCPYHHRIIYDPIKRTLLTDQIYFRTGKLDININNSVPSDIKALQLF